MARLRQKATPDAVAERLREILSYFSLGHVQEKIFNGVLSKTEIQQPGNSPPSPRRIVEVYARSRGRTPRRAAVDLAFEASVIGAGEHRRLRRQIREPVDGPDDQPRPHWDAAKGELSYEGQLIRKVPARAANIRLILGAFQESHWPPRIDNPLPSGEISKQLRDALTNLNKGSMPIRFRADGKAAGILWHET